MRPERVALLSCETRVPETKTQSVLDCWTGLARRSYVVSGLWALAVGSWLEHPFYVHHNNSNVIISRRAWDGEAMWQPAAGQGLEPALPKR